MLLSVDVCFEEFLFVLFLFPWNSICRVYETRDLLILALVNMSFRSKELLFLYALFSVIIRAGVLSPKLPTSRFIVCIEWGPDEKIPSTVTAKRETKC